MILGIAPRRTCDHHRGAKKQPRACRTTLQEHIPRISPRISYRDLGTTTYRMRIPAENALSRPLLCDIYQHRCVTVFLFLSFSLSPFLSLSPFGCNKLLISALPRKVDPRP